MMIDHVRKFVLPAAFELLPPTWDTPEAAAMLLAIGLQESGFVHRRQMGGPARGFWQFEISGVRGVMSHQATMRPLSEALASLMFAPPLMPGDVLDLIEVNDTIAAVCARCLLYTLPERMPAADQPMAGWNVYTAGWRPGKPRIDTWTNHFSDAWQHTNNA